MEFKDRISELRLEKGMTHSQLAALIERGESAVRMWEAGKSKPDMDTVLKLKEIFDCSIDCLFGFAEYKQPTEEKKMKERYYIIRADRAGVFFGHIKERRGSEVDLADVRRIWYWDGACSLSQLATEGTKKPKECKFTVTVPEMTVLGVIEVIPCTDAAVKSIMAVKEWKS